MQAGRKNKAIRSGETVNELLTVDELNKLDPDVRFYTPDKSGFELIQFGVYRGIRFDVCYSANFFLPNDYRRFYRIAGRKEFRTFNLEAIKSKIDEIQENCFD